MGVLSNFDIKTNFWEAEPVFKTVEPFKTSYSNDKSKGKWDSSDAMWCVALFADTSQENRLGRASEEDRLSIIENDYYNKKFDHKLEFKLHISKYRILVHTQLERTMINLEIKLAERDRFLKVTHYTIENSKDLDTMLVNTAKLYQLYKAISEDIKKEKSAAGTTKGDKIESATENKLI